MPHTSCTFDGCLRPSYRDELCQGHSWQLRVKGTLTELRAYTVQLEAKDSCAISICSNDALRSSVLCKQHQSISRGYNVAPDDYAAMYRLGCQICERTDVSLSVDHDHLCCSTPKKSCGACVRGMLCSDCNFLMGWLDKVQLPREKVLGNLSWYYADYEKWGHTALKELSHDV